MLRPLTAAGSAFTLLLLAAPALAVDAVPCSNDPLQCATAPIQFSKTAELPVAGGFNTGWVPADSPLQVRLFAELFASTTVNLAGHLQTEWPESLTLSTPADPSRETSLDIDYGVDVGAEAKVEIEIANIPISWTGDVPFVPQFNWAVQEKNAFDPWAFEGFTVDGSTGLQTLFQVDVTELIGADIPGFEGGIELDVAMDLDATYTTEQIVITHVNGAAITPITTDDQTTLATYLGGPSVDFDVQVHGRVDYDGVAHLVPAFYIDSFLGGYQIPIVDVPVPFTYTDDNFDFETVRVHVPLPDVMIAGDDVQETEFENPTVLAFGPIEVGGTRKLTIGMSNEGEALLAASLASNDPMFTADALDLELDAETGTSIEVTFAPTAAGVFEATLTIATNDPDEPVRIVTLQGEGLGEEPPVDTGDDDGDDADATDLEEGCGCKTAGAPVGQGRTALVLGLGALAFAARRRNRR